MEEILPFIVERVGEPLAILVAGLAVRLLVSAVKALRWFRRNPVTKIRANAAWLPVIAAGLGAVAGLVLLGPAKDGALWGFVIGLLAIGEYEALQKFWAILGGFLIKVGGH